MSTRVSPVSFLKQAADVATFYGFRPMRQIEREVPQVERTRGVHSFAAVAQICAARSAVRGEPTLAFYATPVPSHAPAGLPLRETGEFGLTVAGSRESVSEIVLLKTVYAILTEHGTPLRALRLNASGDRDSQQRFVREVTAYLRRHAASLCPACQGAGAEHPLAAYRCAHAECREFLRGGPRPVNFLSEKSRAHFRSVLEHLESLHLPYELDDLLVGDEREPHLLFSFDIAGEGTVLGAQGGRFDEYVRQLSGKKEGASVSASIFFQKKGTDRGTFADAGRAAPPGRHGAPRVYFVQIGTRAKLQGLSVLDMLRAARVPVSQSFDTRSISPQLQSARELKVSHVIIMGQREVLDGTVIVRTMDNSSQEVVDLLRLPRYLKTLRV